MNVDRILQALNDGRVDHLLVGGVNFLLRHRPELTFDVDVWIRDSPDNLRRCEAVLASMGAEWGRDEASWGPVARLTAGWLDAQPVFCLTTPHGALDVFRAVKGLPDWSACSARAVSGRTAAGVGYRGLCDTDMLACQLALPPAERKEARIAALRAALAGGTAP
jgi:hypothetical protein